MSTDPANPVRPRIPWNKGKLVGPKPPLHPKHVWSIRARLQLSGKATWQYNVCMRNYGCMRF